jgi:hypothetical protein
LSLEIYGSQNCSAHEGQSSGLGGRHRKSKSQEKIRIKIRKRIKSRMKSKRRIAQYVFSA